MGECSWSMQGRCIAFLVLASHLAPVQIDLHLKKNLEEHSTIYYDISGLVLRRGQTFSLTITFDRNLAADQSRLSVIFQSKTFSKLTPIKIPIDGTFDGWSVTRLPTADEKSNRLDLEIHSPSDAVIGKYFVRSQRERCIVCLYGCSLNRCFSRSALRMDKAVVFSNSK